MTVLSCQAWTTAPTLHVSVVRRRLVLVATAGLLGLVHLWLTVGPGVLLPSDPLWQSPQGDGAQAVLGAEALLRDPAWHFPLGVTSLLLGDGEPVSIGYTDSAPWIAILVKAVGLGVNDIKLSENLSQWLGQVRSSGRMFWPVAYAALAWSLLALDRVSRRWAVGAATD